MKKIRLNLDELAVDSFAVANEEEPKRGTVHGRDESADCTGMTCDSCDNCTYNGDWSCSGDHNCFCPLTYPQPCG